ncbi:ATP-binding cassette domain-containing protein [Cuneatibacter sp. NSJ-177]|uniref:ABC transporter ATP-binding protein n=1 Tax=Cuneatibacter sp. NSJ-177 TaxID=2931401 RepID=UPI001FD357E1|nr:oligopeptide/dipeptide ABC transporter ATP-binding protein [Cuneatibacter sp. NSJ-177]MCJ7835114.1 ATP-binding cassette domain-containing protein [Cuneatibacter sp. NSJ-177]
MKNLVETVDLKKYFTVGTNRQLHAVDGINLEIPEGQTLGVVGESGCGKSTLGRVVMGLLPATSGQINLDGQDIVSCSKREFKKVRRKVQMIFQDPYSSLDPRMSIYELIAEPLIMNKVYSSNAEVLRRVQELMETVGLAERYINSYPHELDGGRRQRIGVARALALNPKFIVCDEPVSALDVSIQAQILNLLMDMQRDLGLTYLFITHNLAVVKHISDVIMVMYLGQCVEIAPSDELFANPKHPYTQALLDAILKPVLGSDKERKLIRGEVTSPIDPPAGCRFAKRCEHCRPECTGRDLKLVDLGDGHKVACVLAGS